MNNTTYYDLVNQTFHFPQEGFDVNDNNTLLFNGVDIQALIDKYGTPFKLTYLPKIGMQVNKAKKMFADAIKKHRYEGQYFYCYCTKSSYFSFIVVIFFLVIHQWQLLTGHLFRSVFLHKELRH